MKKLISTLLGASLLLSLMVGCTNEPPKTPGQSGDGTNPPVVTPGGDKDKPDTPDPAASLTVSEILEAVKDAYDEGGYLPEAAMDQAQIESYFDLDPEMLAEYAGELPTALTGQDMAVVLKANEGKTDAVEQAVKETLAAMQQADGADKLPKLGAAQVVRNGDYIALLMVGADNPDAAADPTTQEARDFAAAEVQKAVDAFNACFAQK